MIDIIDILLILGCVVIGAWIRFQTRLLNDVYKIRKEIRLKMFLLASFLAVRCVCLIAQDTDTIPFLTKRQLSFISIVVSLILLVSINVLTVHYPIYLFKEYIASQRSSFRLLRQSGLETSKRWRGMGLFANRSKKGHKNGTIRNHSRRPSLKQLYPLEQVLQNIHGFRLFSAYLASEFSTGLLYFVFVYHQFNLVIFRQKAFLKVV